MISIPTQLFKTLVHYYLRHIKSISESNTDYSDIMDMHEDNLEKIKTVADYNNISLTSVDEDRLQRYIK